MIISLDKKYKTRDGHGVKLLRIDAPGDCPVEGIMFLDHYEAHVHWQANGTYGSVPESREDEDIIKEFGFNNYDLVEIPPTVSG